MRKNVSTQQMNRLVASKRMNNKFEKATKAEKRVMIAKDVIAQIKADNIVAETGYYFAEDDNIIPLNIAKGITEDENGTASIQEALPYMGTCSVCALGGLFYSRVAINNQCDAKVNVETDDIGYIEVADGRHNIVASLSGIFTEKQLGLIESAFEATTQYASDAGVPFEVALRASEYRYDNDLVWADEAAMISIMENIIKNKGTFKV